MEFDNLHSDMTFSDLYEIWFDTYKKPRLKKITVYSYRSVFNVHLQPIFGSMKITDIKAYHLQKFFNDKMQYSLRKCEDMKTILNGVFEFAYYNDLINKNPLKYVYVKKHVRRKGQAITDYDLQRFFLEVKKEHFKTSFMLYLLTGCRPTELKTMQFDFDNKVIKIKNAKLKEYQTEEYRFLPLFPGIEKIKDRILKNDWRITYKTLQLYVTSIFNSKYTIKDFRHTFTSNARKVGVISEVVDLWLGHVPKNLAEQVYVHYDMNFQREESLKMVDFAKKITDITK